MEINPNKPAGYHSYFYSEYDYICYYWMKTPESGEDWWCYTMDTGERVPEFDWKFSEEDE